MGAAISYSGPFWPAPSLRFGGIPKGFYMSASKTAQFAEPTVKSRWLGLRRWKLLFLLSLIIVGGLGVAAWIVGLPLSWTADYDRGDYNRIQRGIAADPQHLLGRRYDEVARELRLENVPWDDIAMQRPTGMSRMYHFRGFRMDMTLELLPQGITPSSHEQWNATTEELDRHGTLWLAHDPPVVFIDGIQTQKERMERYQKAMDEMCRWMNAEADRRRRESTP
jgi:hypothetical protein